MGVLWPKGGAGTGKEAWSAKLVDAHSKAIAAVHPCSHLDTQTSDLRRDESGAPTNTHCTSGGGAPANTQGTSGSGAPTNTHGASGSVAPTNTHGASGSGAPSRLRVRVLVWVRALGHRLG